MHKDIFWFNKHAHFIFGRHLVSWYIFLGGISLQILKSTDRCKWWSVYAQRHILVQQAHFIFGRNLASWYIFLVEHAVIILFWSFPPRDIFQRNNPHKCVLIYSCPVKNWCLSYSRPSYTSWWSYELSFVLRSLETDQYKLYSSSSTNITSEYASFDKALSLFTTGSIN